MLKLAAIALSTAVVGVSPAMAQMTSRDNGAAYEMSPFEKMEISVSTATEKATGRKFNVVKLPNGTTMALISMEKVKALSPFADDSEMMYSGHSGTSK